MATIEVHGPPVDGAHGPCWSAYVSVSSGAAEPTQVLVKLTYSVNETFARKMGERYSPDVRETIMKAFAEETINDALKAGHAPPSELTVRATDDDAELSLRRWGLL